MPYIVAEQLAEGAENVTLAPWIPDNEPWVRRVIAQRAIASVGICEDPVGSNRGPEVDKFNLRAKVPLASYWCAAAAGAWWLDAGAKVPDGYARCANWVTWARGTGRWSETPCIGSAVLYAETPDAEASHIGVIVRVSPLILSVEGNTTIDGYSRNGEAVALKVMNAAHKLGFVIPDPPEAP